MSLPAIVFDLDGTLVDSAPDIARALNALLVELGHPALDLPTVTSLIGDGTGILIQRALTLFGSLVSTADLPALNDRLVAHYLRQPADATKPYPGVVETLTTLRDAGYPMGVCTNKGQRLAELVLAETGLADFFTVTIGGDTELGRKPDPRSLLAVIKRLGAMPADAWLIGDSINDVDAAKAAGVRVVLVSFGYGHGEPGLAEADVKIDRFAELGAILKQA